MPANFVFINPLTMPYFKILIAVDSSEYSLTAAKKGLDLAHQLGATVALLYVIDKSRVMLNSDMGIFPDEAIGILKEEAEQTLDQISAMYDGESVTKFMPEGRPTEDIITTAESWEADLIVMGTHGRTGLMHLLIGSIAEHVLRHSRIPVLVVPSKKIQEKSL
jgi:nucleotide-binding universal stress UspA family protein